MVSKVTIYLIDDLLMGATQIHILNPYLSFHLYLKLQTYTNTHVHIYEHICIHVYIYINIPIHMCVCMYKYIIQGGRKSPRSRKLTANNK